MKTYCSNIRPPMQFEGVNSLEWVFISGEGDRGEDNREMFLTRGTGRIEWTIVGDGSFVAFVGVGVVVYEGMGFALRWTSHQREDNGSRSGGQKWK